MAATTALPATAASCFLHPSRCRFAGASPAPFPLVTATSRRDGGSGTACSCSPGPPPAVPMERRGGGAVGQATVTEHTVRIVAVVGEGSVSPIKDTPWEEVMRHTADRLRWADEGIEMLVFSDNTIGHDDFKKGLLRCDMLVNVAVTNDESVLWLINSSKDISNIICLQSSPSLVNKLGGTYVEYTGEQDMFGKLANIGKPSGLKEAAEVLKTVTTAWERHNSDDIRFCLLVVVNAYIRPVGMLKNLRAKGLSTLSCMIKNCGPQVLNCLFDPNCRKALQCLNSCSPTDQVCNYRCIASYESPHLEAFSLCVLQKHNCLDLNAEIPSKPSVTPLTMFRDQELSHEVAEDLFVGWLDSMEWSWRVAAGQNPAYDQFPCQYQLFYRGKAKGTLWYEPVFQVKTLEGELVWRRRRYRVRRASSPGTFYFSVLDNGVVSKEFWTIVDVPDNFSWGLFHYHGAAQAAGVAYTGAVLVTPDGSYPDVENARLSSALQKCGIKKWELYMVDNCSCIGAPLGTPEGSKLHYQIAPRKESGNLQERNHFIPK